MNDSKDRKVRRKRGKGAAEWYGKNRKRQKINANNRVKRRGKSSKSNYEKRRRGKTKIRKFEEIWTSVERERVAERKGATGQGRWLGYSSWHQTER